MYYYGEEVLFMFCKNCGHKLSDDAKFCLNCGTKIEVEMDEETEEIVEPLEIVDETQTEEASKTTETSKDEEKSESSQPPVSEWYYVENNDSKGSFTLDEMKAKLESNEIKSSTLVWKASMTDWKKLEDTELAEFLHVDTEKDWYYVENNDSKGPFSLEEMKSMISRGELNNDSFVWKTGMQDWVRLKNTELATKSPVAPVFTNTNTNTATSTYAYTSVKEKNIGLCILLSFVTCGFYCLYWLYCLAKDLNELCESQGQEKGSDGGLVLILSIVTCGIYQLYYMYKAGKLISSLTRSNGTHPSDDSVILLILSIFGLPLISYCIIQSNINDFAKN